MSPRLLFFMIFFTSAFARAGNTDSLIAVLNKSTSDTQRISLMSSIAKFFARDSAKSRNYVDSIILISGNVPYPDYKAIAYKAKAEWFMGQFLIDSGIYYFKRSFDFSSKAGNYAVMSRTSYSIGNAYTTMDKGAMGLPYYQRSYAYADSVKSEGLKAYALNGMGSAFFDMKSFKEGMKYYELALKAAKLSKDGKVIGWSYTNVANGYLQLKRYEDALVNFKYALKSYQDADFPKGVAASYNNIGAAYSYMGLMDDALKNYKVAARMKEEIGDLHGACIAYGNISAACLLGKDYKGAMEYALIEKSLADKVGIKSLLASAYNGLAEAHAGLGNFEEAYKYQVLFKTYNDSVYSEESQTAIAEMQAKYNSDSQKQQISMLEKDKETQRLWTYTLSIGLGVIFLLAIWAVAQYRVKNKANKLLEKQNVQIANQKKEITDSINYAKRIQSSILPREEDMRPLFPESFILYKPKDIVSGDFYWFQRKPNEFLIATADCTGHGVPGALMSMVGIEKLEALSPLYTEPSQILEGLNREVKNTLRQSGSDESTRDGMDIALVIIDIREKILHYAGANRPVWIVRDRELTELKPTKAAIGGLTTSEQHFPDSKLALREGDILYMFTDGYADQFGGPEGKKMMTKNFRDFLLKNSHLGMKDQHHLLDKYFEEWKGDYEQVDDILVVGISV